MLSVEIKNESPHDGNRDNENTDGNLNEFKIARSLFSVVYIRFESHLQHALHFKFREPAGDQSSAGFCIIMNDIQSCISGNIY